MPLTKIVVQTRAKRPVRVQYFANGVARARALPHNRRAVPAHRQGIVLLPIAHTEVPIFIESTAVYTGVTAGADALPGPDSWSAVIAQGYAEIQYNSQSSTNISFVYEHCLSRVAGGSTTFFSHEGSWSLALR